jgi:uncharacterized protein (TIGR02147 family)
VSVFDFVDYKAFLVAELDSRPRGARSELARASGCQLAYLSRVLGGDAQLSLEQADGASEYFQHGEEERSFLLLLVERARAGTERLRRHFETRIHEALERRLVLRRRLEVKRSLSREDQVTYYSAWYYAALHVLVTIPGFRSREAIVRYFRQRGVPPEIIGPALEFLCSIGLLSAEKGEYQVGEARIHLGSDSPMISRHHANWRLRALSALDARGGEDLHYSSVVTLSAADAIRVKEILVRAIEKSKAIIRDSPAEELGCLALDFFAC